MKVGIVTNDSGSVYIKAAKKLGIFADEAVQCNEQTLSEDLHSCDWFVVIGNYFTNDTIHRAGPVKQYIAKSGKPFVVVTGSLFNVKDPGNFVRLNVNGFTNNFATMPPSNPDRLKKILDHWKIQVDYKQKQGDDVIVAPNALTSPMMFGHDVDKWVYNTVERLTYTTDRNIKVRYHRKQLKPHSEWYDKLKQDFKSCIDYTVDTKNEKGPLLNNHCVVTYNSTFSVLSLLTGTSNIAYHPGSFVSDITPSTISAENLTIYPSEEQLIDHYGKLANMEWSIEEIVNGSAWKVLQPMIEANERKNMNWLGKGFV
jgi:hypothetical protein